jgi:hypothetical protein
VVIAGGVVIVFVTDAGGCVSVGTEEVSLGSVGVVTGGAGGSVVVVVVVVVTTVVVVGSGAVVVTIVVVVGSGVRVVGSGVVVIVGGASVTGGRITGGGAVVAVVVAGTDGEVWVTVRPGAVVVSGAVAVVSPGVVATGVVAVASIAVELVGTVVVVVSFALASSLAVASVVRPGWAVTTVDGASEYGMVGAAAGVTAGDDVAGGVTWATALGVGCV